MRVLYQYRLRPTKEQQATIDNTLDMLRCQYNYQLGQRFDWYEQNCCSIDRCQECLLFARTQRQTDKISPGKKFSLTQKR